MSATMVALDGRAELVAGLPVRVGLSKTALERLAGLLEVPLPWQARPGRGSSLAGRLGDLEPETAGADPDRELAEAGLLGPDGDVAAGPRAALIAFATARAHVDVDLSCRRPGAAPAQLRAWHRWSGDLVSTVTTTGGWLELGWFTPAWWQPVLARLAGTEGPPAAPEPPLPGLEVPLPLLLASGEAVRLGRDHLLPGLVSTSADAGLAPDETLRQLRRVHDAVTARLQVTVSGRGPGGDHRVGLVTWLRYADGWRELVPVPREGAPWVRLEPVPPLRLGAEVARLVEGVAGR